MRPGYSCGLRSQGREPSCWALRAKKRGCCVWSLCWCNCPNLWGLQGSSPVLFLSCPSPPTHLPPPREANGSNSQATRLSTGDSYAPKGTSRNVWRQFLVVTTWQGFGRGAWGGGPCWVSGQGHYPALWMPRTAPTTETHQTARAPVVLWHRRRLPEQMGSPFQMPAGGGGLSPVFTDMLAGVGRAFLTDSGPAPFQLCTDALQTWT